MRPTLKNRRPRRSTPPRQAFRAREARSDFREDLNRTGDVARALHRNPRARPRNNAPVEAVAAPPRPQARKGARNPRENLFQIRRRQPSGSHKTNSAMAQAFENKRCGTKKVTTETGAGQWGSALSQACNIFGLECTVFMVRCSFEQKPYLQSDDGGFRRAHHSLSEPLYRSGQGGSWRRIPTAAVPSG